MDTIINSKTRIQEIEDLIHKNPIWDQIGEVCEWDNQEMDSWAEKIYQIVDLEIEKHELMKGYK